MEHAKKKLESDLALLKQAAQTLKNALGNPLTDIVRDAAIQRFKYVFELSWKTDQAAGTYMGVPVNSPREAIKAAFKMGWIKNAGSWLEAMEARNKTSHTYNAKLADEVYQVAKRFPSLIDELIISLGQI